MQTASARDSAFECDPRRQQELRMRPAADAIYRTLLNLSKVERMEKEDQFILDKFHAIDVCLTLSNGMVLTGQEKFLSAAYARYDSLTVEYEQNQWTHEHGDWFKLAAQFVFCGYASEDNRSFTRWIMVDWARLAIETERGAAIWKTNANKNGRARASFRYIEFGAIPSVAIIGRSQ